MEEDKKTEGKQYEISLLLRSEEDYQNTVDLIGKSGAVVIYAKPAAKIKLAYPIKKEISAYFGFAVFTAQPEQLAAMNKALGLRQELLRYMILTPPVMKEEKGERPPRFSKTKPQPFESAEKTIGLAQPKQEPPDVLSNEFLEKKLEEILK